MPDKQNNRKTKYVHGAQLIELREGKSLNCLLNPYINRAKELTGLLYTLPELEAVFPAIFEAPGRPLFLDIGCYMGATVIELGRYNKDINVLGLDLKYKRVVKSCIKIQKEGLKNCKIALCNAADLLPLLEPGSLLGAFIFFPDPWEKKRQRKHRLLSAPFLKELYGKLRPGGFAWLKTDNKEYFDEVVARVKRSRFSIIETLPGTIADREYRTLFEEMFIGQGKPIYRLIFQRAD